jgi:cytochrome c oxidase subunit II
MYSGLLSIPPTTATFDFLFNWYLFFGAGAAIIVISMLVIFMVRYRYRGEGTPMPKHKTEGWKIVLVTAIISISVLSAAEYQTFASFGNIEVPSQATCMKETGQPCLLLYVTAFQWGWNFTYPDGKFTIGNLTVPAGRVIILNITTRDVMHSFGIRMLAVGEDAVPCKEITSQQPCRIGQAWFEVPTVSVSAPSEVAVSCNSAGTSCVYTNAIRCFELCGVGHAFMDANLTVISQASWDAWQGGP